MISYVNSFPGTQPWFHFIALNSHMNSWLWIQIWFYYHEFTGMNSKMNSYIWILTYDFTIFFMIKNSYLNSEFISWIHIRFHNLWIPIWIYVYEEYREIIPEIMCTKVPDECQLTYGLTENYSRTQDMSRYCQTWAQWQAKQWALSESYRAHKLLADRVLDDEKIRILFPASETHWQWIHI